MLHYEHVFRNFEDVKPFYLFQKLLIQFLVSYFCVKKVNEETATAYKISNYKLV